NAKCDVRCSKLDVGRSTFPSLFVLHSAFYVLRLSCTQSAVDVNRLPADVFAGIRAQQQYNAREIRGFTDSANGNGSLSLLSFILGRGKRRLGALGVDPAGGDRVVGDLVGGQIARQGDREFLDGGLA